MFARIVIHAQRRNPGLWGTCMAEAWGSATWLPHARSGSGLIRAFIREPGEWAGGSEIPPTLSDLVADGLRGGYALAQTMGIGKAVKCEHVVLRPAGPEG